MDRTYLIESIGDFLRVPADRRERAMADVCQIVRDFAREILEDEDLKEMEFDSSKLSIEAVEWGPDDCQVTLTGANALREAGIGNEGAN